VSPNGAAEDGVEVATVSPSGIERSCPVSHDDEGVFMATFQPDEAGEWKIAVLYENDHIEGSPFACYVYDPNAIRVTDLDGACPCLDFTFTVDSRACGHGETIVDIAHQGKSVPYRVIPMEEGLMKITFRPPHKGKYRIYVYFNGIEPKGEAQHDQSLY
jgi:filamin